MATSIIIHITVGTEKRTEYFSDERIRVGSDDTCDLQIHTPGLAKSSSWFDLESSEGVYRIVDFNEELDLEINDKRVRRYIAITDGDVISLDGHNISFAFFSLETRSSLITTNRDQPHIS